MIAVNTKSIYSKQDSQNFHCIFNMWTDRMTIILRIQQVHHLIFIYVLLGNLYKLITQHMKDTNFVPLTEEFVIAHSW